MATSFIGQTGLPRGLTNNNPGDLKPPPGLIGWQGTIGMDADGFVIFSDDTWGIRALALDIINNIGEGNDTITLFITKYAPASDNNPVASYIANVAADCGIDPDTQLGTDADTLQSLVRAIMNQELGDTYSQMIPDADIATGIAMAQSPVSTIPQAAVIYAQANPIASLAILGILVFGAWALWGQGDRE